MKTLHTPKSWHVGSGNGEGNIFADEGRMALEDGGTTLYPICTVVKMPNHAAEDEANASLISAAPEMLEACYSILNVEGLASAAERSVPAFKGVDVKYHFDKIRTAIAKATGNNQLEGKGD